MAFFCHNKWVAKRQGHRNLEFHIVHLLEPALQTQTATAHLQTTWTVYFDGQGTQKLPCGKIRPTPTPRGGGGGWGWGGEGGIGRLMVYKHLTSKQTRSANSMSVLAFRTTHTIFFFFFFFSFSQANSKAPKVETGFPIRYL